GARSSTTRFSPRRSSTGCFITRPPSTSRARATASGRRRRPGCSADSVGPPTAPVNPRRWEPRRESGDTKIGEQGTSYFGVFRTTQFGLDRAGVWAGRCYEGGRVLPFGPWADAFREDEEPLRTGVEMLEPIWQAELARLLPEVAEPGLPVAGDDRLRLF